MPGHLNSEIITPHLFFRIDQGARVWEFIDKSTFKPGRIECSQTAADRILVKMDLPIDKGELEWQVLRDPFVPADQSPQFELIRSFGRGTTFTWQQKLRIPYTWKVGDSASALSKEGNPATGNPIELKVTLLRYGVKVPKPGWGRLFPADMIVHGWIQVKQIVKDSQLGTVLSEMTTTYVLGLGVVYVAGQYFGNFAVMELTKHTP